jgi:hypothetical protein
MSVSGTLGSLLQGVSQQPPHIRNDGQVTEQVNMVSDVVRGLTSRPGSGLESFNTGASAGLRFSNVLVNQDRFQVGCSAGVLEILNQAGASMTVTPDTDTLDYIGAAMEVYVYDNVAYILNRDKVTAMNADTSVPESNVQKDEGYVVSFGGEFSHTYKITLEYTDGTKAIGTYTAPDGTSTGDAEDTAAPFIAAALRTSLAGHASIKAGTVVSVSGAVVRITGAPSLKLTAEDGSGGDVLRAQANTAKFVEDLTPLAVHGSLVRIVGATGADDDYWMRFEIEGESIGSGFGSEGIWREWYNPFEASQFDLTTMPHVITRTGATTFTLSKGTWLGRRVGDSDTNPAPGFIGRSVRDINGFQSRLAVVSGPRVITTRTDEPLDFFKESATVEADSDPIEIMSTAEREFELEWIVPFDRDLIIFADFSQFIITGSVALTPANASLVQTTNFEMGKGARPSSTGRTLLFPFEQGSFAGVKEFFSQGAVESSDATSITQVQDEYMPGAITNMLSSTNFSFVLVQTDGAVNSFFIHQYYWQGDEKAQASWSRWDLPYAVKNVFFSGPSVNVLMYDASVGYVQTTMNLDIPDNSETGYPVKLDLLSNYTAATVSGEYVLPEYVAATYAEAGDADELKTYIDLPWPTALLVQGTGCAVPGQTVSSVEIFDLGGSVWRYVVSDTTVPNGATLLAGLAFESQVTPTMPFIRDREGKAVKHTKLVVTEFVIYFDESGFIESRLASKYRANDVVFSNKRVVTAGDPSDPAGIGIRSGEFVIPWGERSDWSELTLSSSDVRPMTILEVEWVGQTLTRGRRL